MLVLVFVVVQACGTVMHGPTQEVGISSNPSMASVSINGYYIGNTPVVADLRRKDPQMIRIELEGYEIYETTLTRQVSGWVWGNILIGGLIGLIIDVSTGGMYKLTPDQVRAELRNGNITLNEGHDGLIIAVVLQPNPEWEKVDNLKASTR